jgi:hypothetical protein
MSLKTSRSVALYCYWTAPKAIARAVEEGIDDEAQAQAQAPPCLSVPEPTAHLLVCCSAGATAVEEGEVVEVRNAAVGGLCERACAAVNAAIFEMLGGDPDAAFASCEAALRVSEGAPGLHLGSQCIFVCMSRHWPLGCIAS